MVKSNKTTNKLYRSEKSKILAGVCGGLAEYLSIDPTIIRIIFILLTIFGGGGVIVYFILWLVIPKENRLSIKSEDYIKENVEELKLKTSEIAGKEPKVILGIILIVIGISILGQNLGFYVFDFIWKLWPIAIIAIGIMMLTKKN